MDKEHFEEMLSALNELELNSEMTGKSIFLFGHCNATEELADLLISMDYHPRAILDNNKDKHGSRYKNIPIVTPRTIMDEKSEDKIVLIVARAYAAMASQLRSMGFQGQIKKLVDYNSFADYSLSGETIARMKKREERGEVILKKLTEKYTDSFRIFCPFNALGDIYIMMSYLPYYLAKKNKKKCVICVVGNACSQVAGLFGRCSKDHNLCNDIEYTIEVFTQRDIDETIQAVIYTEDKNSFIAHQDRPYVVNLHKALYVKKISLQTMYCCGVFGLCRDTIPYEPACYEEYPKLDEIPKGRAVILSPYAKSVTNLSDELWDEIIESYINLGYICYTNVVGDERPLRRTIPISPKISQIRSVVEWAGTFVGIRSGLCDVIKTANARKIALYPDYNYCDTKWKAIDIYYLDDWDNIEVKEGFEWKTD